MIYPEIYFACVSLMNFIVCIFSSCFFTFTLMLSGTQREVNRFRFCYLYSAWLKSLAGHYVHNSLFLAEMLKNVCNTAGGVSLDTLIHQTATCACIW